MELNGLPVARDPVDSKMSFFRQWRGYEIEVVVGLEEFAEHELKATLAESIKVVGRPMAGRVSVKFCGDPRRFERLRSVTAAHLVCSFHVPRPRALLGHQNQQSLLRLVKQVLALYADGTFSTVRISAAGADSRVFVRMKEEVAGALGLSTTDGPAHLQMAVRPRPGESQDWQVLVRLAPRPATARKWRVCDYPGALNAAIANVMVGLARPSPDQRFLNLFCGSATLMIERLEVAPARLVVGIDRSPKALACAADNLRASGRYQSVHLVNGDVGAVPMPSSSVDGLVADFPYGMLVDSNVEIERVYTEALGEATRLALPRASFVAITARKKLFESVLGRYQKEWECVRVIPLQVPFRSGYINPHIYHLRRTPFRIENR